MLSWNGFGLKHHADSHLLPSQQKKDMRTWEDHVVVMGMDIWQQKCREEGGCATKLGGEGRAGCEEGPLVHRIKRRKMAAQRASKLKKK